MTKEAKELISLCPYDGEILASFDGKYEAVYILLHPFMKPRDKNKAIDLRNKNEIIKGFDPITWQTVLKETPLKSLSEIDVGLRTRIGGLRNEFKNDLFSNYLEEYAETGIEIPDEGDLPPLLENRLFLALQKIGIEEVWVADEFQEEKDKYPLKELIETNKTPFHGHIYTKDQEILITTHWDSHCSFLCSSKKTIQKILEIDEFEGFYASENTQVYWGVYEKMKNTGENNG